MVNKIVSDYKIPKKHHKELRRLLIEGNKKAQLVAILFSRNQFSFIGDLTTEQFRLEKQIKLIWGSKPIEPEDISEIKIVAKGKMISSSALHLLIAVWEQLCNAQLTNTKPSKKPLSINNRMTLCYGPFANYLMQEKLILYKGEPSKNEVAKIISNILSEIHSIDISEQQINKTLANFLKITP
jgi:hypothetical protein